MIKLLALLILLNLHASAQRVFVKLETQSGYENQASLPTGKFEKKTYRSKDDALAAISRVITSLNSVGYLNASIDSAVKYGDTLQIWVYPGDRYLAASIEFPEEDQLLARSAGFGPGRKRSPVILPGRELERITSGLHRQGYALASISIEKILSSGDSLSVLADIDPGPFYRWDTLEIKGDLSINNIVLQKHLRIREGEPYNNLLLAEIERNLQGLRYLKLLSPPGIILTETDKARIVLPLEKQKASAFNGVIGFGPDRNNPDKLIFSGDVQLKLVNAFSQGEEMEMKWNGISGDQLLMLTYKHPFLPLLPFGMMINFDLFKQGELYYSLNQRFGLLIRSGPGGWFTTYIQRKSSRVLDRSVFKNYADLPPWTDFSATLFGVDFRYQQLDYPQNPSRGIVLGTDLAAGRKTLIMAADIPEEHFEGIDLTQRQIRGDLSLEAFFPFTARWIFRPWLAAHWINSGINHENELIRIGGINSIRGFEERSIAASAMLLGSVEIRYRFEQGSHFKLFFDGGWYEKNLEASYLRDLPFGFGIGIALPSPAGILQVNYAWGIQQGNPFEFRSGRLHFGLTSAF
ncbi:MAG: BamA/TamA family outer membrane protein [Bacteroidales bacterium]